MQVKDLAFAGETYRTVKVFEYEVPTEIGEAEKVDAFVELAGETARYPWAHHALVAGVSDALGVSPPTAFALLNVAMFALAAVLLYQAAAASG